MRLYSHLFLVEEVNDDSWEQELNPQSEVVISSAFVDPSIFKWNPLPETHVQAIYDIYYKSIKLFILITLYFENSLNELDFS